MSQWRSNAGAHDAGDAARRDAGAHDAGTVATQHARSYGDDKVCPSAQLLSHLSPPFDLLLHSPSYPNTIERDESKGEVSIDINVYSSFIFIPLSINQGH